MPTNISVEKIKELIRLAEQARAEPGGRANASQRGSRAGSPGSEGAAEPVTQHLQSAIDQDADAHDERERRQRGRTEGGGEFGVPQPGI